MEQEYKQQVDRGSSELATWGCIRATIIPKTRFWCPAPEVGFSPPCTDAVTSSTVSGNLMLNILYTRTAVVPGIIFCVTPIVMFTTSGTIISAFLVVPGMGIVTGTVIPNSVNSFSSVIFLGLVAPPVVLALLVTLASTLLAIDCVHHLDDLSI